METTDSTSRRSRIAMIQAFGQFGMPGMTLAARAIDRETPPAIVAPAPTGKINPKPLLHRCVDCGQVISRNKQWCRVCNQVHLLELGEQIGADQDLLDAVLRRSADPENALDALLPYLKFTPRQRQKGTTDGK